MVAVCHYAASANSQLLPARQVRFSKFARDGGNSTSFVRVLNAKLDFMKRTKEGQPGIVLAGGGPLFYMGVYALIRIHWFTKEEPVVQMLPAKHLSEGLGALVLSAFFRLRIDRRIALRGDLAATSLCCTIAAISSAKADTRQRFSGFDRTATRKYLGARAS